MKSNLRFLELSKKSTKKKGITTSKLNALLEEAPEKKESSTITQKNESQADPSTLEVLKENIEELDIPKTSASPATSKKPLAKKAVAKNSLPKQRSQHKEVLEGQVEERRQYVENLRSETQAFLKKLKEERLQRQKDYQAKHRR